MYLRVILLTTILTPIVMSFTLSPYNLYDSWYEDRVRSTLSRFHINLSNGKPDDNGPMVSKDIEWNFGGTLLISRESFVETLKGIHAAFHPLAVTDRYHVIDGNGMYINLPIQLR